MNLLKDFKERSNIEALLDLVITLIIGLLFVIGKLIFEILTETYTETINPLILGIEILILLFITIYFLFQTFKVLKTKEVIIWRKIFTNLLILWIITIPIAMLLSYLLWFN